jgi:hypothetical protein
MNRFAKGWTGFLVIMAFMLFNLSTAYAQDLSGWVGKWFKLTVSQHGYQTLNGQGQLGPETETVTVYLNITAWDTTTDPANPFLQATGYASGESGPMELYFIVGSDLDFVCLGVHNNSNGAHMEFTARISGKQSKGVLSSATFKSMGGYFYEADSPTSGDAGSTTITGHLISESKLPPWVP